MLPHGCARRRPCRPLRHLLRRQWRGSISFCFRAAQKDSAEPRVPRMLRNILIICRHRVQECSSGSSACAPQSPPTRTRVHYTVRWLPYAQSSSAPSTRIVHHSDGMADDRRPWLPCARGPPHYLWCGPFGDRWPGTLLNRRHAGTYSEKDGGLIFDVDLLDLNCGYAGDGDSYASLPPPAHPGPWLGAPHNPLQLTLLCHALTTPSLALRAQNG